MQRLQVELVRRLSGNELHGWPLHSLGDRLGIAEVVLLPFRIGTDILRRHQPGIVAKAIEFTTEMVRANAGLHADQARWQVGKSGLHLATRPLLAQHNGTTLIVANDVERVLADIDADDGDGSLGGLGHGVLLVVGAPCQL